MLSRPVNDRQRESRSYRCVLVRRDLIFEVLPRMSFWNSLSAERFVMNSSSKSEPS